MSELIKAPKALLFASVIWNVDEFDISLFQNEWQTLHGELEVFAPEFNPSFDYYQKEMGEDITLKRKIFFSNKLIERDEIVLVKKWATKFELEHSKNGPTKLARTINIDPGLLTLENMLLSTGKPFSHRIYLGEGVYADLNYIYRNGSYQTLDWTYPDYAHEEKIQLFNKIRKFLSTK